MVDPATLWARKIANMLLTRMGKQLVAVILDAENPTKGFERARDQMELEWEAELAFGFRELAEWRMDRR